MQRLTPLAAAFLEAEDEDSQASLAIGSLAIFEGPPPPFEDFVRSIEARLPLIPRYRQKLRTVPFDLTPPAWVEDPDFDLEWHIRHTAVPAPGGPDEIGRLLSRVMTQRMDRSRPLWEYWLCEGLSDGKWGLLSKLHHSMVDGVSGTDLYRLVLDADPNAELPVVVDDRRVEPTQSTVSFVGRAMWDSARTPALGARALLRAFASPRRLVARTGQTAKGLVALSGALRPAERSSLTGPLDGSRRYAWTSVPMSDIRAVRHRFGVTVNDVSLAAITGGFRQLLLSRGETPTAHTLRSLVPVSTRQPGQESIPDNRVSLMLPYLPVELTDAESRLRAVQAAIRALRSSGEPVAGDSLTTAAEYSIFAPVSLAMRASMHVPQRQISTVTTSVPGPRMPLYALGRQMLEVLPYVPIADRVRIGVAMFSYCDTLTFAVTADFHSVPDIQKLVD
ncbi:MAG: wax ester/triacylglycerol synthase family O-acyltransferase, partial [Pseudonocardiales bacterium]